MSEPIAITELRRRVEYAKEVNEQHPTLFGNHKLGVFLTDVLQAYDNVVENVESLRDETSFVIKAARGTRMDDAGIRQLEMLWKEYHTLKEELASERSKRKQIEELYDNLKADVAPLIKAAKELNEAGNDDTRTIHNIRRTVKYL